MKTNPKFLVILLASVSALNTTAQVLTADITRIGSEAFYYDAQNITYVSGGSGEAFGGAGELLCIEIGITGPDNTTVAYNVVEPSILWDVPAGAARGEDYFHWVFDNHYERLFDTASPDYVFGRTRSNFQQVLYELVFDYNGTVGSLSTTDGQIYGAMPGRVEYIEIVDELVSLGSLIPTGYRSTQYDLTFLENVGNISNGAESQNLILVNTLPAVPEASSALLVMLISVVGLLRRSRKS